MKFSKTFFIVLFCLVLLFLIFQGTSNKFILQAQTGGNQGYPLNYVAPLPSGGNTGSSGGNQGPLLNLVAPLPDKGNTGPYSTQAPAPGNVQNKPIPNSSVPTAQEDPAATNRYVSNIRYFDIMGKRQGIMVTAVYGPNPCTPLKLGGSGFFAIQLTPYNSGSDRYAYMPVRVSYKIEFKDAFGNVIKKIENTSNVNYGKWSGKSSSGWIYGFYKPQEVQSIAGNRRFRNYYEIWFDNNDANNIMQIDLWAREKSILLVKKGYKKLPQAQKNNLLKSYKQVSFRAGGLLAATGGSGSTAQASGSACMGTSGNQGGGKTAGCPVDIVSGSLVEDYTDMTFPSMSAIAIMRHYDSGMGYQPGRNFGWMFNFEEFLRFDPDGSIFYRDYKFSEKRFLINPSDLNNYIPSRSDNLLKLKKDAGGNYEITFKDQTKKVFNSIGYLINTVDSKGNITNYTWNIPFKQMKENYDMPPELIAVNGPNEMFRKNSTLTITGPYGRNVYVDFNDNGRVSKITDWSGRYVEYNWSGSDNMFLLAFKDLQGNETKFLYNENKYTNISEIKYPNGTRVRNDFLSPEPPNSQVVKYQNLTDGGYISYDYGWLREPQERWTTVNESGRTVKYYYDENGNIIKTEEPGPNGAITYKFSYTYQTKHIGEEAPAGLLASKIDPLGRKTSFNYDARGNLTEVKNAQGKNRRYGYDNKNRVIDFWDELNRNTHFEYDSKNNLISIRNNDGTQKKFEYDDMGRLIKAVNENGNYLTYEYGAYGNFVRVTDQEGGYTRFYRDSLGRAVKTDENGFETSYEYDNFNNVTKITDGAGNSTRISYDGNCNVTGITDPNGKTNRFVFDQFNRLTQTTDPEGHNLIYRYTPRGKLFNVGDPMRGYVSLDYNSADYLNWVKDQIFTSTYYNYDPAGNVTAVGNSSAGKRTEFVYDELNRMIKKISDGEALYEYDDTGNIKAVKDKSGQMVYEYDDRNRLARVNYPLNNIKIEFKYDKAGNLTYFKHINGAEFSYEYDKADKPISITKKGEGAVNFKYNEGNNLAMVEYPNGVKKFIAYNNIREIVRIKYISDKSGEMLYQVNYEYDKTGRIISKEVSGIGRKHNILTYVYTDSGRLAQVKINDKVISQYIYDANGNRISSLTSGGKMGYNYDAANHLLNTSQTDYSYDPAGNLINEETGSKVKKYIYDTENNFIKFEFTGAGKFSESYSYNADNLRISKECKEKKEKNNLIWLGWKLLGKLNDNGDFSFVNYDSGFEKDGKLYWYVRDIQGSVEGLTSEKGDLIAAYDYDEFGNPISSMAYSEPTPTPAPSGSPGQPGATPAPPKPTEQPGVTPVPPKPTSQPGTPTPSPQPGQTGTPAPKPSIILNLVPQAQPGSGNMSLPPAPQPGDIQTGVGGPAGAANNGQVVPPTNQPGQPGTTPAPKPQSTPQYHINLVPQPQPTTTGTPVPKPTIILNLVPQPSATPSGQVQPMPQPGQPTTSPSKPSGQAGQQAFIMPAANAQETVQTNTQVKKPNAFIEFIKKIFTFWKKPEIEQVTQEKEITNKIESPIRFAGYYYDNNTELYYIKSRYYNPKIGRFTQPDKISYLGGLNLYAYCGNDPVNYTDPEGLIGIPGGGSWIPRIFNPRNEKAAKDIAKGGEEVLSSGQKVNEAAKIGSSLGKGGNQSADDIYKMMDAKRQGSIQKPGTTANTVGGGGAVSSAGGASANSPNSQTSCDKGGSSSGSSASSGSGSSASSDSEGGSQKPWWEMSDAEKAVWNAIKDSIMNPVPGVPDMPYSSNMQG